MKVENAVEVNDLFVSYYGSRALEGIDLKIPFSNIVGIVGPNGAGKSTLIKAVMGLVPMERGSVKIQGKSSKKSSKKIAYVPQYRDIDHNFPVTVKDVVMMGRYPYIPILKRPSSKDHEAVMESLEKVGLLGIKDKQIGELSGGQTQRVFLARALAQESSLLFLDEPFAGIDISSEGIISRLLKKMRDEGRSIVVVHHDLSKADELFDRILLLNKRLIKYGKSEEVFQPHYLEEAYEGKVAMLDKSSEESKEDKNKKSIVVT